MAGLWVARWVRNSGLAQGLAPALRMPPKKAAPAKGGAAPAKGGTAPAKGGAAKSGAAALAAREQAAVTGGLSAPLCFLYVLFCAVLVRLLTGYELPYFSVLSNGGGGSQCRSDQRIS